MVATFFQNGHKPRTATLPHQQKAQTHRQRVKDLLPNRTVGYSPDLARAVGGATIGLFLSQLLFLSDKGADPNGWVYKSEQEMGRETGLSKREQQTARRKLLALGVIQIQRRGWKNTYHFRIIWERLEQVIQQSQREQNVSTTPEEWEQNVPTQYRDNNRDNRTEETDRENQTIWNKALDRLKAALPPGEAEARLTGTTLLQVTDTAARILVPSTNALLWLERRMYRQISNTMKGVLGKEVDLQFVAAT